MAAADLERLFAGSRFIAGGDLNSSLLFDADRSGKTANADLFANLAEAGFVDLRKPFFGEEQPTWFRRGARDFQLDHVYADAETAKLVSSWRVVLEAVERERPLSDHAPIEVILADEPKLEQ